jgi:hypothetical protein
MVYTGAGAYVNKLILFEREFMPYEAMQIHGRFGDIYRSARIIMTGKKRKDKESRKRRPED